MNYLEDNGNGIDFKADTLIWKDQQQQLVLKDHVSLGQKGFLHITTDDQIVLSQAVVNKKKQLDTIESQGKTVLTVLEPEKNKEHHLTCYGKTFVDHSHYIILMDSPIDEVGKVLEDQQVFFEDDLGTIYADKLTLQYNMNNKTIVPQKLILEGNVKMLNSYASGPDPNSPLIRYVIADRVEYTPQTKEAVFTSRNNVKRVLFYDKANDMEVSATTLKIKRDEATKKETVKGVGDVRFSFVENEFEQLRKRFVIDRNSIKR
jgi:lipopolysaccharide export system protein LptA